MSVLRPKFITSTFSSKKKKRIGKSGGKSFHIEGLQKDKDEIENDSPEVESDAKEISEITEGGSGVQESEEYSNFGDDPSASFDWWPDLSDLDRLNIQNAPLEDRARLLAAKVSMSIEHTMQSISERKNFPLLDDFIMQENLTRNFPLR